MASEPPLRPSSLAQEDEPVQGAQQVRRRTRSHRGRRGAGRGAQAGAVAQGAPAASPARAASEPPSRPPGQWGGPGPATARSVSPSRVRVTLAPRAGGSPSRRVELAEPGVRARSATREPARRGPSPGPPRRSVGLAGPEVTRQRASASPGRGANNGQSLRDVRCPQM